MCHCVFLLFKHLISTPDPSVTEDEVVSSLPVRQIALGCSHLPTQVFQEVDCVGSYETSTLALQNKEGFGMCCLAARGSSECLLECFVLKFEASKPKIHQA